MSGAVSTSCPSGSLPDPAQHSATPCLAGTESSFLWAGTTTRIPLRRVAAGCRAAPSAVLFARRPTSRGSMPAIDIRPCTEADLPAVVDLLLANMPAERRRPGPLMDHAREVYFRHPWVHPEVAPLVCFGADGRLNGFIGATARHMLFKGEPILVAVPGNFVVRPGPDGRVDAFSAIGLVRRFLTGPQDLSLTDTSNDMSRRMWEAAGGAVVAGLSVDWFRPIRPVRALLQVVEAERKTPLPMSQILHAVGRVADLAGAPVLARMGAGKQVEFTLAPFDPEFLLQLLGRHRAYDIVGAYDRDSLGWLMRQIEAKAAGRTLSCHTVTDGKQP